MSVEQARRAIIKARKDLELALERETLAGRIAETEPKSNGRIVKFSHRFGGKVYSYAAIRADNYRGARRWFITSNDGLPQSGHRGIVSPCTWTELVGFAIPHTIMVAPLAAHWVPVAVPVEPMRNLDELDASLGVTRAWPRPGSSYYS